MCLVGKNNEVHLRCFDINIIENQDDGWTATIVDNIGGIEAACWATDSRQIITFASNNIRLSIWSLVKSTL